MRLIDAVRTRTAHGIPWCATHSFHFEAKRVMVNESPNGVRKAMQQLLDNMAPYKNFILSTGCDLPYETPLENIRAFMEEGRTYLPN